MPTETQTFTIDFSRWEVEEAILDKCMTPKGFEEASVRVRWPNSKHETFAIFFTKKADGPAPTQE